MKTLTLLRHAKAVPPGGLEDHERPLSPRGHAAAAAVGKTTSPPALILCSTSLRTRQTLADLTEAWGTRPEVRFESLLYLAGPATLLRQVEALPESVPSVWLIGHNPGLHELALALLAGVLGADAFPELRNRFPTAGRATFEIDAVSWAGLGDARRVLSEFAYP
ncbi:MAG TPA: histidine phosphatase family protein [Stellaceae bacterium]|nr:histidine phosphatase family protein [Stellaceae bacterium]